MSDYGNMEKVGDLPQSLPRNDEQISTVPGDLILYLGRSFVIYYDTNSWNFTRLGKIDGITSGTELKSILGNGDVDVILSLSSSADIKDITSNNHTSHDIYDINGRRVSASDCSMPSPGIYIIDGIKKVLK